MSEIVTILGSSGMGKSSSIRTLTPEETFIVQCTPKMLPFKGSGKKYTLLSKDNPSGNLFITDKSKTICEILKKVGMNEKIKTIVIDDLTITMLNSFMRQVRNKASGAENFEKFNNIGADFSDIVDAALSIERDDLIIYVMLHTISDDFGNIDLKTVGKLVRNLVSIESKVSVSLYANCEDGNYYFLTNGINLVKSPMGMFGDLKINNDLAYVSEQIKKYKEE